MSPKSDASDQLAAIAHAWDAARYESDDDAEQLTDFRLLEVQTTELVRACPDDPRPRIWLGAILGAEADNVDLITGLQRAGEARDILLPLEDAALDSTDRATLETLLGALYAQAPPFPISFGDRNRAELHFQRALRADPSGIEPNYYYADFLYGERRFDEARRAYDAVLRAPPRPDRDIGDASLRSGARVRLNTLAARPASTRSGNH